MYPLSKSGRPAVLGCPPMWHADACLYCRHIPGTLQLQQAQELGLGHKEATLVMTDVQSSSKLWEW